MSPPVSETQPDDDDDTPFRPKPTKPEHSASAEAISQQDDRSVYEWLRDIGTGTALRIKLVRSWPKTWKNHNIGGMIEEFDELIPEAEIRKRYGGGKYTVKCLKQNPKGGWQHAGSKTFEIAGDPVISGEFHDMEIDPPTGPAFLPGLNPSGEPLQRQAMATMERLTLDAQKRANNLEDESRRSSGIDPALLKALTDPVREQARALEGRLSDLSDRLAEKDKQVLDLLTRKPESTFQDRLLDKMVDGESARIEGIRTQHDSELRQLRESHAIDLRAAREHGGDEIKQRERSHERELESLKLAYGGQLDSLKTANEARIDGLKGRLVDLERQLVEAKTEQAELRARKEKGPIDAMTEIAQIQNAMQAMGMGGQDQAGSVWERVLSGVLDSSVLKAVATRIESAPTQEQPAPPTRPKLTPEQIAELRAARAARAAQAAQATKPAVNTNNGPPAKKKSVTVDPVAVAAAIGFAENAVRNNTDPQQFAASVQTMIPQNIVEAIRLQGVDKFLAETAKLEAGSPLSTQAGRNFMRKVGAILIGGGGGGGDTQDVVAAGVAS